MIRNLLFFIIISICIKANAQFVSCEGSNFYLNGKPYSYVGANYWYGPYLSLQKNNKRGINRLRRELDFLNKNGVTNLRIVAAAEGSGLVNGIERIGPPYQLNKLKFDDYELRGLDVLLAEMGARHMKAVIFLSNNWEWSGGFLQYLHWNGEISDSLMRHPMDWETMRDVISKFYNCKGCIIDYLQQVKNIVLRTNSITGKKYKNDPTIMAWEIANEPRPMRPAAIDDYEKFIAGAALLIQSLDRNHLVTTGVEGYIGTDNIDVYTKIHLDSNIDYCTIHIWPKNWAWYQGDFNNLNMDTIIKKSQQYIAAHDSVAREIGKPLVLEEFGLPRDKDRTVPSSPTQFRDRFYKLILEEFIKHQSLAGINFWAFAGEGRPLRGQKFWKKGDDYLGDPPMEPQGLYSVFNNDHSTWKIIKSFAKKQTPL